MMHKLLNLENFSVYWDVDTEMFGELFQSDLAVCLAPPILSLKTNPEAIPYIFRGYYF